jgi:hypothetical protein
VESKKVTVQGNNYEIERFRGLKAVLAIAALTRVAREVPDVLAQRRNTVTITPALAKIREYPISEEDFERAGGGEGIELPAPMSNQEQILAALPDLLQRARKPVMSLFAILIISNEKLKEADKADRVEQALDEYYDLLMYETELDELADLALGAYDVLQDQLADRGERLGKMFQSLGQIWRSRTTERSTPAERIASQVLTQRTSSAKSPPSSTDSPEPTDGVESTLSSESPGTSSVSTPA